jgi:predicted ribosome quality control (RQC) complex YloA/Tae2 family protein
MNPAFQVLFTMALTVVGRRTVLAFARSTVRAMQKSSVFLHHNRPLLSISCNQISVWRYDIRKSLFLSTTSMDCESDEDLATAVNRKSMDSLWNIPGLKKEVQRRIQRSHKKIGQYHQRIQRILNGTQEGIENMDADMVQAEIQMAQTTLQQLNQLEELITTDKSLKKKGGGDAVLPEPIAQLALQLNLTDAPPARPPRGPPKPKGPRRMEPRVPYRTYRSADGIEIRVGKRAEDNDALSTQYCDPTDWWLHASGCPGSHVIIRFRGDDPPESTLADAAALAASQSKLYARVNGALGEMPVTLTRCRHVKKPPLAKAGLVLLTGPVRTLTVRKKDADLRLQRLNGTLQENSTN